MASEKKYLRRLDIGLVFELDAVLIGIVRSFLDQAGLPYEELDAPPEQAEEENTRRRRST